MTDLAVNLANATTKNKRRELDFYPTPANVTVSLMEFLQLPKSAMVWEPAAGDGAMSDTIRRYNPVVASDIRPNSRLNFCADFLTTNYNPGFDAIITNPPFNLSEDFIRHAISLDVGCVAMLLKSQYWHAAKRQSLFEETKPAYVLPLTWRPDFMNGERGGAPTMEVCWTVWLRDTELTGICEYRPLSKPK